MNNFFAYKFFSLLFKWSLVYFLVLIVMEDLKPTVVVSHFSPHWFLLLSLLSGLFLFFFPQADILNRQKSDWRWFDYLLVLFLGLIGMITVKISLFTDGVGSWIASLLVGVFISLFSWLLSKRL